jgi:NAD(P)-dependent dehydrogenase (short-subunit alcohol dehydrogenase family)
MERREVTDLFELTGRVAIVTGGTRGIGRAIAGGLAAVGARVVVAGRKADACESTQAELEASGAEALGVTAHMGEIDDVRRLVDAAVDRFDGIDIVVNNAATALAQPIEQITPEAWAKSLDVNLRGPVFLVQAALPHLRAGDRPARVNVISVGAVLFGQGTSMYASGKGGLLTMTRYMAAEFAAAGVRVNALAPGSVDTDMVRANPPEAIERMAGASMMGRLARPEEMVGPALFLASDASSYMTGQVLVVDGGLAAY